MTTLVYVASPYRGDIDKHERYARAAMADCIRRGEAPLAPHLLYTQVGVLDDAVPADRALGMALARGLLRKCDKLVLYTDYGVSSGMAAERDLAAELGIPMETRGLENPPTLSGLCAELTDSGVAERVGTLSERQVAERRRASVAADVDDLWDLFGYAEFPGLDMYELVFELAGKRLVEGRRRVPDRWKTCLLCGETMEDARAPHGYAVRDSLWTSTGWGLLEGVAHLECFEVVIKRPVTVNDLKRGAPCNRTVVLPEEL